MCQKLLIIISNIQFWVWDTNFSHFSPKKAKKTHFRIRIFVLPTTKCYRNPFFGYFEPPKEYGGVRHRYLGKVKFFRVNWITKRGQKCDFWVGAFKAPLMVGLRSELIVVTHYTIIHMNKQISKSVKSFSFKRGLLLVDVP